MKKSMRKRKIFLTGAGGFIGSHLASRLVAEGCEVTALLRSEPKKIPGRPALPAAVVVTRGDLTLPESYRSFLPGHDALIHLAADYRIGLPPSPQARRALYASNVIAALALMEEAREAGIPRLIHASTTAALGETHGQLPGEDHRHNGRFRSYYEETKHICHELLRNRQEQGIPVSLAILGGVFGPGDTSALAFALREYLRGKLPFQVETASRFQLCPVEAVCDAFVKLLRHEDLKSQFLFTGKSVSMPELFALAARPSVRAEPKRLPAPWLRLPARIMDQLARLGLNTPLSLEALNVMDNSVYTYSSAKAETELGWRSGDVDSALETHIRSLMAEFA